MSRKTAAALGAPATARRIRSGLPASATPIHGGGAARRPLAVARAPIAMEPPRIERWGVSPTLGCFANKARVVDYVPRARLRDAKFEQFGAEWRSGGRSHLGRRRGGDCVPARLRRDDRAARSCSPVRQTRAGLRGLGTAATRSSALESVMVAHENVESEGTGRRSVTRLSPAACGPHRTAREWWPHSLPFLQSPHPPVLGGTTPACFHCDSGDKACIIG